MMDSYLQLVLGNWRCLEMVCASAKAGTGYPGPVTPIIFLRLTPRHVCAQGV